jgi:hypothetical protein
MTLMRLVEIIVVRRTPLLRSLILEASLPLLIAVGGTVEG